MPMPSSRSVAWLSLVTASAVGYFVAGPFVDDTFIGLAPSHFPAGPSIQALVTLLFPELVRTVGGAVWAIGLIVLVAIGGFGLVRAARRREVDPERRRFLTGAASGAGVAAGSAVLAGGLAFGRAAFGIGTEGRGWSRVAGEIFGGEVTKTDPNPRSAWKGSRIRAHRRLGRTGFEISDVVLGTSRISGETGEQIARQVLERGVNYLDTAPDYSALGSEQAVGRALASIRRDQVFVATKFCTALGHLPAGSTVDDYVRAVESSLGRLATDYVDLVHVHSCDERGRLLDPHLHEAFDRLKQAGKARFLGFSTHTPRLEAVVATAIDSGRFDVMMVAYHHGIWPHLSELIARARREQDMGVVAMKTLKGARHHKLAGFREDADAYSQAALKWVLSNQDVSAAIISFFEFQHADEYLHASGRALTDADLAVLRRYDQQIAGTHCAPHCGACLDHCPDGLPIADVLRHRMYFEDYGQEKEAMRLYARLEKNATACLSCSAPCTGSCPNGIEIGRAMRDAHQTLSLG